jgi:TldD protein
MNPDFQHEGRFLDALLERGSRDGLFLVLRAQRLKEHRILVSNGKTEKISTSYISGVGFQAFDSEGYHAFASVDTLSHASVRDAYATAVAAIRAARGRGYGKIGPFPRLAPETCVLPFSLKYDFDAVGVDRLEKEVREIHWELLALFPRLKLETFFQVVQEVWRIVRSDGADVAFSMPRCAMTHTFFSSASGGGTSVSVSAPYATPSYELVLDGEHREQVLRRARNAATQAERMAEAGPVHAGACDILIDYALAKGLAHEALGHAAESDSFRSSILASGGKFRGGETVASEIVSVVDESIPGDFAYQPFSSNGARRSPARIIRRGVLESALTDVFSAESLDLPLTGAGRAENFRCIPRPRMSNIRIEVEGAAAVDRPFEELGVEDIREILSQSGLLARGNRVLCLTGYRGGQVNPSVGEFVFNCSAIYELSSAGIQPYRPALFCGLVMEALKAVKGAFGPLKLDAIGVCGKWGQNVPSSGGCHYFLYIEKNRHVSIGGQNRVHRGGEPGYGLSS